MSNFQELHEVDNPQSREEDEELEEQKRRQEELTDLLTAGIHPFSYDDSTVNSSITSVEEAEQNYENSKFPDDYAHSNGGRVATINPDNIELHYKAVNQHDQLNILYEVRMREIKNLKDEFDKYKEQTSKEVRILKNKIVLSEAELRHLQVSFSNSESLLVEKTETINNLKQNVTSKDEEIANLNKITEQLKMEIVTYSAVVNELQLKLCDGNPFSASTRKYDSEELQKAHRDQIMKLEALVQEQSKKNEILNKEKAQLQDDTTKMIQRSSENDEMNNVTIVELSKKLKSAQQQCKDLFALGEAIKKESDHFKKRIQEFESDKIDSSIDGHKLKKMDKEVLMTNVEKLKRMLLDKDIEINTHRAKLKFYNSDMEELFEYRNLLSKMYNGEVKSCNKPEHEELIVFMQGQLQTYEQAVEDRNGQIMNLSMVNKELQEKIEEMLQQTRTDIQNLSQKYSLPQLQNMSSELKYAEETIKELNEQLSEKNELIAKLEQVCGQDDLALHDKENFEKVLKNLKDARTKAEEQKRLQQRLTEENEKFKADLEEIRAKLHTQAANIDGVLTLKNIFQAYVVSLKNLKPDVEQKLQEWLAVLNNFIECNANLESDIIANFKSVLENVGVALQRHLKDCLDRLEKAYEEIGHLNNGRVVVLKESEEKTQIIEGLRKEICGLHQQLNNVQDVNERKNTLKDKENLLPVNDGTDTFQKCLEAEALKSELLLREQIQAEYVKKLQNIEERYKDILVQKEQTYDKEKGKMKTQELTYRKQFAIMLDECMKKTEEVENENAVLMKQMNDLNREYQFYKNHSIANQDKYVKIITELKKNMAVLNDKWVSILEYYMASVANIGKQSHNGVKTLINNVKMKESEMNLIENMHVEKIKKYKYENAIKF